MINPIKALIEPRLPAAAIGIEADAASVVALDKRRGVFSLQQAAYVALPAAMVTPDFDGQNIVDAEGFADLLAALAVEAGLARRQRWSAALPTLSARTAVLVLESGPTSRAELSEMLSWKIERGFGAPAAELRVSRQRLANDERGRTRFLATAIRLSVLSEYEAVFENLGWNVGLILPRPLGEVRWLLSGTRSDGDGLMVSSHAQGFTAMIVRGDQPVLIRSAICSPVECADELYRLLLFYSDRSTTEPDDQSIIDRMLVVGESLSEENVRHCISEALNVKPRALTAESLGLSLPSRELSFAALAAPAGLASLKWA